jgi:hypothetical protein
MGISSEDVRELIQRLREDPELREAVRAELADDDLRALPLIVRRLAESQERTEVRLAELAEAQRRTEAQVSALTTQVEVLANAQQRTEARIDALATQMEALAAAQVRIDRVLERMDGRVSNLEGWRYEMKFNAIGRVAQLVRRPVAVSVGHIDAVEDAFERGEITEREWDALLELDGLFAGRRKGSDPPAEVYVALEISRVVDSSDVRRAADRAEILRKCGLEALAVAGGREVTADAAALAEERSVTVLVDRSEKAA